MLLPEFMPESIDIKPLDRDDATALLIENAKEELAPEHADQAKAKDFADAQALVESLVNSTVLDKDPAAWHTDEYITAFATIHEADRQAYRRIYYTLKTKRVAVDVDREVKAYLRKNSPKTPASTALSIFGNHGSTAEPSLTVGSLLTFDDQGRARLRIESEAALIIAEALKGKFGYSQESKTWHQFNRFCWAAVDGDQLSRALIKMLYAGTDWLGFRNCYLNAIRQIIENGCFLPLPCTNHGMLPFKNGLLDYKRGELVPITPDNAQTWFIPHDYDHKAKCPTIISWLIQALDGDMESVELARAWWAALIHGRADLQKFIHLIGSGGTGKGVFLRLSTALIGSQNSVSTTFKRLDAGNFENARCFNKRLVQITDSERNGGTLETFKALTGQDEIPLERKHQQSTGGFVFGGMVAVTSNENIVSSDNSSSALGRRRVTVVFDRRATEDEKQNWQAMGGEEAVLHSELPGLVNWLLELSQDDISRIIRNPPQRTKDANFEAMIASNPVAGWLVDCCMPDAEATTQVGSKIEIKEPGIETTFEGADERLYPNYLQWSQRNVRHPVSAVRFRDLAIDTCKTLGFDAGHGRSASGRLIRGIRLKKPWEDSEKTWSGSQHKTK